MFEGLVPFLLAGLALMGSPGPATLSLTAVGAAFGRRESVPYLLGIISGTTCVLLMISFGLTGLLLARPAVAGIVTIAAAVYILYLAFRIAAAPPLIRHYGRAKPPAIAGGFILAIANPKAYAAIGAVYAGHQLIQDNAIADAGFKIAALTLVIIAVNATWLMLGSWLSYFLTHPVAARVTNVLFALLLILSVGLATVAR